MVRKIMKFSTMLILSFMMLLTAPVFTGTGGAVLSWEVSAADSVAAVSTAYNGKSPYYLMVNRQMNTVTVYAIGEDGNYSLPVKAMVASCGRSGHATPAGTFSTPDSRYTWRLMVDGTYGQYASRIQGSILFHSICYTSANKNRMISSEYDALGNNASLGCVRLQTADAKWIYDNCPTGTLVTVYDSPEAGALGKPQRAVNSVSSSVYSTWDPTDPDSKNPWRLEVSWAVSGTGHGEVEGIGKYRYGETVSLTAVPDAGSAFECWFDEDWNVLSTDPVYVVTVDREKRLTASFRRQISIGVYASASGTATESFVADPGAQVTVTTEPRTSGSDQPVFQGWYDGYGSLLSSDSSYTFTADNDSDLYAMYEGDSYGDIPFDAWYLNEAAAAKKAGITTGITPVLFGASQPFTRAMTVQMIARAAGADLSAPANSPFVDVPVEQWYAAAVVWANKNGIVKGISETEFAPDQVITRQDMLVMMGRYMASLEEQETDSEPGEKDSGNKDSDSGTGAPDSSGEPSGDSGESNSSQPDETETGENTEDPSGDNDSTIDNNGTAISDEKDASESSASTDEQKAESSGDGEENVTQKEESEGADSQGTGSPTVNPVIKANDDNLTIDAVIDDEEQPGYSQPDSGSNSEQASASEKEPDSETQPASGQESEETTLPETEGKPSIDPQALAYTDTADIAEYALPWFLYAQERGLLKGYEDNTVRPLNVLNRAEGTVLIMRMLDSLNNL